jgi:cyclic pyranopterin phosphate synthase
MPASGGEFAPATQLLTFAEILRFVSAAVPLGINKIRLTGGEPLLRPRLAELIAPIAQMTPVGDVALTTNAVLLAEQAKPLHEAGLRRLNVHLDTLDRERFRTISRRDDLGRVMKGIDAAQEAGYDVIKINAVAIKGLTEPDVLGLVRFGRARGIEIRFIEFMPLDAQSIWSLDRVLTADEMIGLLEAEFGPLTPVANADRRAPATEYQFEDGYKVGFIASVSRPFCLNCNRLRLTSDGRLRYCLFANEETDVRHLLKGELTEAKQQMLTQAIRQTVWDKWIGHQIHQSVFEPPQRPMYSIGG